MFQTNDGTKPVTNLGFYTCFFCSVLFQCAFVDFSFLSLFSSPLLLAPHSFDQPLITDRDRDCDSWLAYLLLSSNCKILTFSFSRYDCFISSRNSFLCCNLRQSVLAAF